MHTRACGGYAWPDTRMRRLFHHSSRGNIFLASIVMTVKRPSADVNSPRNCLKLSSHARFAVTLRGPGKITTLSVPVQSEFTVYVPENVSTVMTPFKLDVALPFSTFPLLSRVNIP